MHKAGALAKSPPLSLPATYTKFVTRFGIAEVATIVTTPAKWAASVLSTDTAWETTITGRRLIATRLVL